ncbi:hypothetical protein GGQ80_000449 [Sphingomonas jinjuensis]|uniref:DUF11 domain-containing protein n=1 Tax=Sphingomonas jinjuensis TaxID=535907 RepID=A0A840EZX9_9SPHN|nr:hypothetical protein [Sphingomonas jinjuensis]MBB4152573.1 hypothetical protein [Sphingomonas jinjuensis]
MLALVWLVATPADATETPAGSRIVNVAAISAQQDGRAIDAQSNRVDLVTAERLDLTLARVANDGGPVDVVLTNSGNGKEAFDVRATTSTPGTSVRGIAIDRDGNGRYDPAIDLLLSGPTPALAPGGQWRLLVLLDSDDPVRTTLTVSAAALTASGTPGTIRPGAGDGGGDAVVGPTGAQASVTIETDSPSPGAGGSGGAGGATLVKSQTVLAPDGSATAVRDAIITYTLVARFAAAATAARLDDPVPAGTIYVPGSLMLDGAALSDTADGDAGNGDGRAVTVALGDVAAGTTRTIRFQARIQ